MFDDEEELEEKSGWEKQLEKEQKERELLEGAPSIYSEIPEKLSINDAIWYYNVLEARRDEVYRLHFAKLKTMEEWLEIYVAAKDDSDAKKLAFEKLFELDMSVENLVELHEARAHDNQVTSLCIARISEYASRDFDKWHEAYDLAPFSVTIGTLAMKNMRSLAKTTAHWQVIYDRSDIGSQLQGVALQQMILLGGFAPIARKSRSEEEMEFVKNASKITPNEWLNLYDKTDIHSLENDQAIIGYYLSAGTDHEKEEES